MTKSKIRVSLVIPAYNEESYLALCLDAIAAQTVKPYEVLVVDNNSTDATAEIARRYPFVRLLREPRQGVAFARDRGFNAARGDVIGRLDGDTLLATDWVERTQEVFADGTVAAATGKVHYRDMLLARLASRIDLVARRYMARRLGREVALQGANMALRRSAWLAARKDLCYRPGIHEDYDIAIHVNRAGGLVVFDERMITTLGYRLADIDYRQFRDYCLTSPRTYAQHELKSGRKMYPVVGVVLLCYLPLKLLRRAYDKSNQRFSWRLVFTPNGEQRVNPATHGDF